MAIKDSEETYLRPLDCQMSLTFRFQNIQNNRYSVFIILSDYALISICSIRLDQATLFLTSFSRLMILQQNSLRIQNRRILSEQQSLHFDKLNILVLTQIRRRSRFSVQGLLLVRVNFIRLVLSGLG